MDVVAEYERGVDPLEWETVKRVAWRLLPLLMLGYICAFLDRVNVGMAAPTMSPDLGFSNAVFGFGSGIFFLGYMLAEVPSNLILDRIGARIWLARIMITWGIVAALTAFVWNDWSFYIVRFLLGVAEAGLYPGVVFYMILWFPAYYRARMMVIFQSGSVITVLIGAPISGLLLQMNGLLGLHGWQWLFLLETIPSVIMAWITWKLLTDRPPNADWLSAEQRNWLVGRLETERRDREAIRKFSLGQALTNGKMWLIVLACFGHNCASYTVIFFLPLIVKGLGVGTNWIGLVSALPFVAALPAMFWWAHHSDLTGDRTWHLVGAWVLTSAGLAACILIGVDHPVLVMLALVLGNMGLQAIMGIFWSVPSALLTGTAAAGGIAMITAIGNTGGWFGPWIFGWIKDITGSDNIALLVLALTPIVSSLAIILAGHDRRMERIPSRPPAA
jgi:ACS family tartrate transporter-like MFS transporter